MTRYLGILSLQEPGEILGLDENRRRQWSFNVEATKVPSSTFAQELVGLIAAAVGPGVTVLGSQGASVPPTGSVVSVIASGGAAPLGTHNEGRAALRRPTAQIVARATRAADAEALAHLAYSALVDVTNRDVSAA